MKKIKLKSFAKINLTLEIVNKLPNGFHELRSIEMKTPNLFDEIEIFFDKKIKGIEISCNNPDVPTDNKNICHKIIEKFFKKTGLKIGIKINILKRIPVSSGLGGGSSNGASVLLALNEYFDNILTKNELIDLAESVGKDIPFFISKSNAAYISGMGEKIQMINDFPKINVLIVNPTGEISTPWAYGELDKELNFMNDTNRKNISEEFLKNKKDLKRMCNYLYNDFEIVAKKKYSIVEILEKMLVSFGAASSSISGKGPTVFAIFENKKELIKARKILQGYYPRFFIE